MKNAFPFTPPRSRPQGEARPSLLVLAALFAVFTLAPTASAQQAQAPTKTTGVKPSGAKAGAATTATSTAGNANTGAGPTNNKRQAYTGQANTGTYDGPPLAGMYNPRTVVPDVRGRTPAAAQEMLLRAGLRLGSTQKSTGPGTPGIVFQESPSQGTVVNRGSVVNLAIVAAPPAPKQNQNDNPYARQVPSVLSRTPEQAQLILRKYGLYLGSQVNGPGDGTVGTIYAQNPPPGLWVEAAVRVDVRLVQPQPKTPGGTNPAAGGYTGPGGTKVPPQEIPWVIVPQLIGQTMAQVQQSLSNSDLRAGNARVGNAAAPAGTIYGQQPQAGTHVRAGTSVDVLVAAEPKKQQPQPVLVPVPDLRGSSPQTAGLILQHSRLNLGSISQQESASNVGRILTQTPPPGTRVTLNSSVDVTVASEIPLVTVPSVVTYDESRAADRLGSDRLRMGRVTQRDSDQASGTVLAENPAAGSRVRVGSTVDIVVSRQIQRELTVMVDHPNPETGSVVKFHAHLDREDPGFQYQFAFGDGQTASTGGDSTVTHVYENVGTYQVSATATRGTIQVASPTVGVTAKDVAYQVSLSATPEKAKPGNEIALMVKNSRVGFQTKYKFDFADGTQSDWSKEPFARHTYLSGGTYLVKVRAQIGKGPIVESAAQSVEVERPVSIALAAALSVGLAGLAGGAYFYHGWKQFTRLVRTAPRLDPGTQEIRATGSDHDREDAQLRVVWPPGEQFIRWAGASQPRKAEGHD